METPDLVDALTRFDGGRGLSSFIQKHQFDLCKHTVNSRHILSYLRAEESIVAATLHQPSFMDRNFKLYHHIAKVGTPREFIEALDATGNEQALEIIRKSLYKAGQLTGIKNESPGSSSGISNKRNEQSQSSHSLAEKLEEFGLRKFINSHRLILCKNTVNPAQTASFLNFDADQVATIMDQPDNLSKCCKLYELIEKQTRASHFLEALEVTNNGHVLKVIESILPDSSSSRQNPSSRRGIWFNIPQPIDSFCGREDFLTQLHDQLKPRDDSATEVTVLSQVKIVSGLGGIGKTQTARLYISKYFDFYNNFIWIDAESETSMRSSFFKLAEEIRIPVKNSEGAPREIQEVVRDIYNKICQGGKSNLIVFDNAEDYLSCRQFFPFGLHPDLTKPVILATSRNQEWISPAGKIRVLPLDRLTDDESLEFILKELEIEDSPEFREESKEFLELVGGLPLALQQAVAYIKREKELKGLIGKPYKISDYVQEFKLSTKKFLSFSPVPVPDSSPTVFVTYNLTLLKFFDLTNGEEAIKILAHLSFLYADKIPSSFLHDLVPEIKDSEFSGAIKLLEKYSLIKMNGRDFCLSIHRQLQFVILQYLKECGDVLNLVMNIVDKCTVVLKTMKMSERNDIFLNIHQIVANLFNFIPMSSQIMNFVSQFALILSKASRYAESLDLYKKVYSNCREMLGESHQDTIEIQLQIALQLFHLGGYDKPLSLYREILDKQQLHFGVDHPVAIATKHNIAAVLLKQEKYAEALELFQQVLAQMSKIHGDHPSTLTTKIQIASLHLQLGNVPQALALYEEVELKQTAILGPDHPDVLRTKHNKATVLYKMGKFEEALIIFKELYEKRKEAFGESHLETVSSLDGIAGILITEGKLTEAFDIYQKTYEMRKTSFGEDHPDTVTVKRNMAGVLWKQEKYGESLEFFQQVLAQMNKVLGENHPETLTTQHHIALLYSNLGNFSEALVLYQDVEIKQTEVLGPHHVDVLTTKHNKATVLYKMGKFEEALIIFKELYEKRKEAFGESHLETIRTLELIAVILGKEGKLHEALGLYKQVYEVRRALLGEDHPDTVNVKWTIENAEQNGSRSADVQELESTMTQFQPFPNVRSMETETATESVNDSDSTMRHRIGTSLTFLCENTVNVAKFAKYLLQFKLIEERRFHELMRLEDDDFTVCYYLYEEVLKLDSLPSLQNALVALNASENGHIVKYILFGNVAEEWEPEKPESYDCKKVRVLFINQKFDSPGKLNDAAYAKKKRDAADMDRELVTNLFEKTYKMKLQVEENIESDELFVVLKRFKRKCVDGANDGCMVIISTHGMDPHFLLMDDLKLINLERDVLQQFGRDGFPEFNGKPKIFLFNGGRNERTNVGPAPELMEEGDSPCDVSFSDILIGKSTLSSFPSYGYPKKGSLYLKCLHDVCVENVGKKLEIQDLLNNVGRKVVEETESAGARVQIPSIENRLFKKMYLKPQSSS